jgi:hypothetical protein
MTNYVSKNVYQQQTKYVSQHFLNQDTYNDNICVKTKSGHI